MAQGGCTDSGVLQTPSGLLVTANAVYVTAKSVGTGQGPGVAIFDRDQTTGALTRRPGAAGCISETGNGTVCADGHGLALDSTYGPGGMAVSADGTRLFVASPGSDAVVLLGRNPSTGALGQNAGAAGCISQTGAGPCNDGRGLVDLSRLALSPDGTSLYASGNGNDTSGGTPSPPGGVAWMQLADAGLTQQTNTSACFQQATDAECTGFGGAGRFVAGTGVTVSPDGEHVYAGAFTSSSIVVFDRTPANGGITFTQCLTGAAVSGCTTTPELANEVSGLTFATGTELWAAVRNKDNGFASGRFQRFDRNPATGALSLGAGCVSDPAINDTCTKSPYLFTANDIDFTSDGKTAVATAHLKRTILAFDRASDGRLATTTPATGGCFTALGAMATCAALRGVDNAFTTQFSPDDRFAYGAGQAGFQAQTDGLTVFRRDIGPPSCSDQAVSVPAGGSVRIALTCTEPDQEPLLRSIVAAPSPGVLSGLDQGGAFVDYAPGGTAGARTLRFKATANGVDSNVATITIDVQGAAPSTAPAAPTPLPPAATKPPATPTPPAPPAASTKHVSAKVGGATITLGVPGACVPRGTPFSATLGFKRAKRKGANVLKVASVVFSVGTAKAKTDRTAPFRQRLSVSPSSKPGARIAVRARVTLKARRGKARTKSVMALVVVCA